MSFIPCRVEITDVDRAVLSLKTQRRRLEDHRTRVMSQITREKVIARELVAAGHKDRAVLALKKKRLQETTLVKLDAFLLNVESMVSNNYSSKQIDLLTMFYIIISTYPVSWLSVSIFIAYPYKSQFDGTD